MIALSLVSAALFGAMTVAIRVGFAHDAGPRLASVTMTAIAFLLTATVAFLAPRHGEASLSAIWPFALAGVLSPGLSNLFFTHAIAEAGASRASVVVGTAPLVSGAIALAVLHEPLRAPLVMGAILIVLGGLALASERVRPEHFRMIGLVLAFAATLLFSTRDSLVRWLAGQTGVAPLVACSVTLLSGLLVLLAVCVGAGDRLSATRLAASARAFVPAGLLLGASYTTLFEAYYRGRVTVVSPLVATESLWGVTLSALVIGRSELVGRRILAGAALIVAGGALIGAVS
ncbi:MAG: DMT family transporter [Actinobacteria bacterium]|nr:DMT family transporter [Actinomycetota bacterium]